MLQKLIVLNLKMHELVSNCPNGIILDIHNPSACLHYIHSFGTLKQTLYNRHLVDRLNSDEGCGNIGNCRVLPRTRPCAICAKK